jgi:hypothetical protein
MTDLPSATSDVPVAIATRALHPRHGVHRPRAEVPARRPGSIRRTATIDSTRPGEILGDLVQIARARDVITGPDGSARVVDTAEVHSRLAYVENYRLTELATTPARPELDALLGTGVTTGFRAAMGDLVPDERERATLLHLLLDDLPGAALVSGYAIGAAGAFPAHSRKRSGPVLQVEGLCAGFQAGSTIMQRVSAGEHPPVVTGPGAPPLVPHDDPDAWHDLRALAAHDCRRARLLDVRPGASLDDPVAVEAYFRDSHMSPDGLETVIHEYSVIATVDTRTGTVLASSATAHSLPWLECIEAEASGDRLAGMPLRDLRPRVREEFTGVSTCTHLNDTLRSIEDVRSLAALL